MQMKYLTIALFTLTGLKLSAQETWDLSQCVDYALTNNIELNQAYNQVKTQKVDFFESKMSLLPNIVADVTATVNYGRSIDENNQITHEQTLNNYYSIEASLSLFRGLVKYNTIAFNRYMLKAQQQNTEVQKNQLVLQIMTAYYSALYSQGLSDVAQKQMDLSELQYERMEKLVAVGKESPLNVQELKSQWASDKLSFVQAQNNAQSQMLELKQLLRISANNNFAVDTLDESSFMLLALPNVDSAFMQASNTLPNIKYQEYLKVACEKDLAVAKGKVSPNFYVAGGYYTYYYGTQGVDNDSWGSQMTDRQNPYVGVGVNIPLLSGASKYASIKRKKIALNDQELQIEKEKDALYAEIWNALNDLEAAKNEYESSVELFDFSELAFENTTKKLEKGLANATDFEASKQRYVSAEAGVLKARLIYVMRSQMMKFYLSGNWGHL